MYQLIIYLYMCGVRIYSLFNEKAKKLWQGQHAAIQILREKVDPNAQYIWFHAASLGEFEQGRPLIEHIKTRFPQYKILLTFFSPSGYEVRKDYEGADIITYLPLDTIRNARRFLRTIRPVAAFFIKYEFWYNYLHILKHRGIPVFSVSSIFRPDQIFFRWYGRNYAYVLKCFTHFFVQNEESKNLLKKIGIRNNVTVSGDTRFDRVMQVKERFKQIDNMHEFSHYTMVDEKDDVDYCAAYTDNILPQGIFVAGSSWPPDEDIFIRYFREKQLFGHGKWKMIIAPHVIDEAHLQQIEQKLEGLNVERFSKTQSDIAAKRADVLIIDCFGLLSSIYRYATITYVGGGFGESIHNLLEAAVWGKPVFFGPNNHKFQEAQDLKANGGGIEIASYKDFERQMDRLIHDEQQREKAAQASADYVKEHARVIENILDVLQKEYAYIVK